MEPKEIVHDICRSYLQDLTPKAADPGVYATVLGYLRSRDISKLATCSQLFDQALHSVDEFRSLRQIEAFYRKNALFANPEVCERTAKQSFFDSELQCSLTNRRLRDAVNDLSLLDPVIRHRIREMRLYISRVLGEFSSFRRQLPSLVRVTPGATSERARRNSLPQMKMTLRPFVTRWAYELLQSVYNYYGFDTFKGRIVKSNRVELVPKNWKTSRTIACEPEGNLALQLAFDSYAKERLRSFGIDLSDQSSNVKAAQAASIDGLNATVDLKAASDTVAYNTVMLLFPDDWLDYLCRIRSPFYRGVFGHGTYAKFSSMGNGATFCVETLIFAAACYAVNGNDNFLVYGDDIIIRQESYRDLWRLLGFLGFTINEEKTFTSGPFRESCGGDFFDGECVTPVYIREINQRKATLCHLVNTVRSVASPEGRLMAYLKKMIFEYKLSAVPYNEDTMSGVWIDPGLARRLGILASGRSLPRKLRGTQSEWYRAYVPKTSVRPFIDSRGYYLWFLNKNSQVLFGGPWSISRLKKLSPPSKTSEATIYDHKYVRKWVSWREPTQSLPWYLYLSPKAYYADGTE